VKAIDLLSSQLEQRVGEGKVMAHGRRALLIDPTVFDALRIELAGFLGEDEARGSLNRFGYAMGHSAARRLRERYHWNDEQELIAACPILMSCSGLSNAKLTGACAGIARFRDRSRAPGEVGRPESRRQ
jgi:Activator of aromatic catabolism